MGSSWHKKNDLLAAVKREMRREMEEIRFLRTLLQQSPMGGLTVVVKGEGHRPEKGPTIRQIVERIAEREEMYARVSKDGDQTKRDHEKLAEGMWRALEIMNNPYRFLNEDERAGWDAAETGADKIISERAPATPDAQSILPAGKQGPTLAQVKAAQQNKPAVVTRRKKD